MRKVFVIGIDGATPSLIEKWREDLPNLRRMMEGGIFGKLESTIPPATSPAWHCMFTGKNPGKIGIYDFFTFPFYRKGGISVINHSLVAAPCVWDILSIYDKKVGIMNVPTTFPPKKVNGFMVSGGLLTPMYSDLNYTYPLELKEQLNMVSDGYEILPFTDLTIPGNEESFLEKFEGNINKHIMALKYLLTRFDWDFLAYVFFVTDSVQHYFWHHMDESHPWHTEEQGKKYGNGIKDVYKKVDGAIGELMKVIPQDTNILIVSDHGGGPRYGFFLVNEWLREQGLLAFKKGKMQKPNEMVAKILSWAKSNASQYLPLPFIEFIVRNAPRSLLNRFLVREQYKYQAIQLIQRIDWSKTKAYGFGSSPNIFVNLMGREPEGIVDPAEYEGLRDEITQSLRQIKAPITGKRVVSQVLRREEIYWGEYSFAAPDLVFVMDDFKYVPRSGFGQNKIWTQPDCSGGHSRYGTLIAYGPDVNKTGREIKNAKIYDITPTILHLFGLPIPEDMDGTVLKEIFEEGSEPSKREVKYQARDEKDRTKSIIKKLKRLGKV